jgi:rare lipoprotein A (peptidoglycan hydrolase)
MRIAFFKHALLAGLLAASLGTLAPVVVAFLDTADAAASAGTPSQGAPASGAPASVSGTPISPTSSTPPSTPAAGGSTGGSTSGGAAPTPVSPGRVALATWFGPGFYGHTTACGQTMSPTLVGVASRTLPCGTLVQVGYRGRQLTVPVLDRGPYGHNGAVLDLTTGAARALALKGTARITTQIVGHVPNTPALGLPPEPTPPAGTGAGPTGPSSSSAAAATGGASAR